MWDIPIEKSRAFVSAGKYFQGPGEINRIYNVAKNYGSSAMILIDPMFYATYSKIFEKQFAENGLTVTCLEFGGVCSDAEVERIKGLMGDNVPDCVFGMGGGMTSDTTKILGFHHYKCPTIIMPTAISSDASTSGHSVVRNPDGSTYVFYHPRNPDCIIVDTEITITAPLFMLSSGLGDAMATYYEACASMKNRQKCFGSHGNYKSTLAGPVIAKLAHDTLMAYGRRAYEDAKEHILSDAYENIAEANTLLSGVGFENTHCSIAHGMEDSLFILPLDRRPIHGLGVGYGVLLQLLVEEQDPAEFEEIYRWCGDVGLPQCLGDLGFHDYENLKEWAEKLAAHAIETSRIIQNEPMVVTTEMLMNAVLKLEDFTAHRRGK